MSINVYMCMRVSLNVYMRISARVFVICAYVRVCLYTRKRVSIMRFSVSMAACMSMSVSVDAYVKCWHFESWHYNMDAYVHQPGRRVWLHI
jgi:hypothetical protein